MSRRPEFFEEIRKQAEKRWEQLEQDPDLAGPWHQLFKQVQSPRHVLSELLQNADDAKATEAHVEIKSGEFVFSHNGEDFTREHFESLCRFGFSNKRALHTIGFRGIGFKSTFSLGNPVHLTTPTLAIEFDQKRFTEPKWRDVGSHPATTIVSVGLQNELCQSEVEKNLEEWLQSPASLLFFKHIRSLTIGDQEVRWKHHRTGPIPDSQWMALSSNPKNQYLVIRSQPEEFPAEALKEIKQERLGDYSTLPPCRVEVVLGLEGRLFVVLPTGVSTDLPFACNAPFVQDPARVQIKDPTISPTNRWLLQRVGELAAKTLLAWVANEKSKPERRAKAYRLLPRVAYDDGTIDATSANMVKQAFANTLGENNFLMTEDGGLVSQGRCHAVPQTLLDIWTPNQVSSFFSPDKRPLLSRLVEDKDRQNLSNHGYIVVRKKVEVLGILENKHLPSPKSWRQLLRLWSYISGDVNPYRSCQSHIGVNIIPVRGQNTLHSAGEVVRLGEKRLLRSEEDWAFLSRHLLVLNQNWFGFLEEQKRKAKKYSNEDLDKEIAAAYNLVSNLKLHQSNDISEVINKAAEDFFRQDACASGDCIRLAHMAATLGAKAGDSFQFITRDGCRRSVKQGIIADMQNDLDEFFESDWLDSHQLHADYNKCESCTREEWRQWLASEKSGALPFAPLKQQSCWFHNRICVEKKIKEKGSTVSPNYPYKSDNFLLKDWNFEPIHCEYWKKLAAENLDFWGTLLNRILGLPTAFWNKALNAEFLQQTTRSNTMQKITDEPLHPGWVMTFRGLPCLQDTRGVFRYPAELLLRVSETVPLLDAELFVREDLDNTSTRPLLLALGVGDTPTGPDRLLQRLSALAKSNNPPLHEVEKWYHRLDQLIGKCSTSEIEKIKSFFRDEKVILTESLDWCNSTAVFLTSDEDDVPDAAVVHSMMRQLTLWKKIGVADRPTADLAIRWISNFESGQSFTGEELRRIHSLLSRYPERIWNECDHWLNLNSKWTPTKELAYSLTMQSLVPCKHLYDTVKQKTADFQKLRAEVCEQAPFSSLRPLAPCIEDRIENNALELSKPLEITWIIVFGKGLCRIILDEKEDSNHVRKLAYRLARTKQCITSGIRTTPYIDGTPVGTPRQINVLWKDLILYVESQSSAKMAKAVAQELGRAFNKQEIVDAIKLCYERTPDFVTEYLEENFNLLPEAQAVSILAEIGEEGHVRMSNQLGSRDRMASSEKTGSEIETLPDDNVANALDDNALDNMNTLPEDRKFSDGNDDGLIEDARSVKTFTQTRYNSFISKKIGLMERFATEKGFVQDGPELFRHRDGSRIVRASSDQSFPWEYYSAADDLLQCYWDKEHCLQSDALQLDAEIYSLCQQYPDRYTLLLVDTKGSVFPVTGRRLNEMQSKKELELYPAKYRLVYVERPLG